MTDDSFVRSFNRRRLLAKISLVLLTGIVVLPFLSHWAGFVAGPPSAPVLMLSFGAYLLANWILCKCPGCTRFIGIAGEFHGLPRGAPCKLESRNLERLDWPES